MKRFLITIAVAVGLVPAIAVAAEGQDKAAAPAAAEKVQCVPLFMIDQTKIVDDKTILFIMKNGVVWRNELPFPCHGLKYEDRFSYKTSLNQRCSTDIITVLPSMGIPGPSCGLGEFVRDTSAAGKKKKKDEKK